jgi:hypothetical protein
VSAAKIIDTGGKFATGINNTSETCGKIATVIVDSGGKFATGINNTSETGGKICVLLIPVVHLDLQISPQIFEKI